MRQVYIPLTEYTTEYRYSYYLSFLVRVFFQEERYTKVQRKEFIIKGKENGFTERALKNIWQKGACTNKFITVRNSKNNLISLKGKHNFQLVLVPEMTYSKVDSITAFKLFITSCIAGKESKDSKGRGYQNIASKTGTKHKQTAYRRVKKAQEKFGLDKKKRVCAFNGYLVQLTNMYSFGMVTYIRNKYYNSVTSRTLKSNKAPKSVHTESIWENVTTMRITKKLKYATDDMYREIFNPIIYG